MKKLKVTQMDHVVVIQLRDDFSQNDYLQMRTFVNNNYLIKGLNKIVIDCEKTNSLPSIAFGVFCSISRDSKRTGGNCFLIHLSAFNLRIIKRTHIDKLVNVFATLNDALDQYRKLETSEVT
jgi:anti-anti-sigma factor